MSVRDNRQQLLDNEWSIVPLIPYDVPVNSAGKRPWHNDWVKWADTPAYRSRSGCMGPSNTMVGQGCQGECPLPH